jgi:hypothetical protein
MIFQHSRFQVWNKSQHPYVHALSDFLYTSPALPTDVTNVQSALDYIIAVLYPQTKPSVATQAALPALGNTINDYRIVEDDGDGKAAGYRWEQREGEASASWHKVLDVDFGADSILQQWNLDTLQRYVSKYGHNDLDEFGIPLAGDFAGQRIYGGVTAGTNLTLYANSGDGIGSGTGFVQFGDNVRPFPGVFVDLGTATSKFADGFFSGTVNIDTTSISGATLDDTTGAFSFSDIDLVGIGSALIGTTLLISTGSISDSTGAIDFGGNNLDTVGDITADSISALTSVSALLSGSTIGDVTIADGSITSVTANISFGSNSLSTLSSVTCLSLITDDITVFGNSITATTAATNLDLDATQFVRSLKKFYGLVGAEFSGGDVNVVGAKLQVYGAGGEFSCDELKIDGKTFSSTVDEIWIVPNGTSLTMFGTGIYPYLNNGNDLGKSGNVWQKLWLGTAIGNASGQITMTDLLALKSTPYRDSGRTIAAQTGDSLFWSGTEWLASPPDTEITHSTISGLTSSDAGHTQFAMLAGRSGGQTLAGGTGAGENLTLSSTSHATKGSVYIDSSLIPIISTLDIGGVADLFRDVYTTGEFKGFRLENLVTTPGFSAPTAGRLIFNTTDSDVYLDTGTAMKRLNPNRYSADTTWDGVQLTQTFTVTDVDARYALWQLKDNNNSYEVIYTKIEAISSTQVRVTTTIPLPAGAYRLTGIE